MVMTTSCSCTTSSHQLALALVESFVHGLGVAAFVFGTARFHVQADELRAYANNLILHRRAHVVGADHRAQALRRGDGLSPATPAPITKTRAGVMVPAAVINMGKIFGRVEAAKSTDS